MGIREQINEHRVLTGTLVGVVIAGALALGLRSACSVPDDGGGVQGSAARQFFTVDDGKSWFPADASKIPPFQYEGKTAYRAKVYRCPDGKVFVSYLERYNDADKKRLEALTTDAARGPGAVMGQMAFTRAAEVKRPGEEQWVRWTPETGERYERMIEPRCPDGSANAEPVLPE